MEKVKSNSCIITDIMAAINAQKGILFDKRAEHEKKMEECEKALNELGRAVDTLKELVDES